MKINDFTLIIINAVLPNGLIVRRKFTSMKSLENYISNPYLSCYEIVAKYEHLTFDEFNALYK